MKQAVFGAMVLATFVATGASAQTIVIAPEQRTMIKEYVVKERVRPAPIRERMAVGAIIPADVELVQVPDSWGPSVQRYRYVYSDDRIILVEPGSRRVIQVIE